MGAGGAPLKSRGEQSLTLAEEEKESIRFAERHNPKEGGKDLVGVGRARRCWGDRGRESRGIRG